MRRAPSVCSPCDLSIPSNQSALTDHAISLTEDEDRSVCACVAETELRCRVFLFFPAAQCGMTEKHPQKGLIYVLNEREVIYLYIKVFIMLNINKLCDAVNKT